MTMKRLYSLFLLLLVAVSQLLAEIVTPMNNMTVWGTMGEGTQFSLDLVICEGNPGIVSGTTIYRRKNGSTSNIAVYGQIVVNQMSPTGNIQSYHVSLREQVRGKVCGNFDFDLPARGRDEELGLPVGGRWWLGQRELEFQDVCVNGFDVLGDEVVAPDVRECSGTYGYCSASSKDKSKLNTVTLQVMVGADSTVYRFGQEIEGKEFNLEFRSDRGYGPDPSVPTDCWTFHLGNVKYNVSCNGGALVISRDNPKAGGIDGLPQDVEIAGVYPRLTYWASSHSERKEGEAVLNSDLVMEVPMVEDPIWTGVCKWVQIELGGDLYEPCWQLAEEYTQREVEEMDTWEDMDEWNAPWSTDYVGCDTFNPHATYLNLYRSGTRYMGGAHGMPFRYTQTLDRKTGHLMRWKDWFTRPEDIQKMVSAAMHEQNPEVGFYEDDLALPMIDPWFSEGEMYFMYTFYEATPYSEGTPTCSIPVKNLLPYMTAYGKKVAK